MPVKNPLRLLMDCLSDNKFQDVADVRYIKADNQEQIVISFREGKNPDEDMEIEEWFEQNEPRTNKRNTSR